METNETNVTFPVNNNGSIQVKRAREKKNEPLKFAFRERLSKGQTASQIAEYFVGILQDEKYRLSDRIKCLELISKICADIKFTEEQQEVVRNIIIDLNQ